jgi:hypothetical protein
MSFQAAPSVHLSPSSKKKKVFKNLHRLSPGPRTRLVPRRPRLLVRVAARFSVERRESLRSLPLRERGRAGSHYVSASA